MFGLSFGEILVLVIVGVVVLGPRRLPEMMRTAGQWVSKLRRLSTDLRAQSGIDDLIRQEGLENEIHELRSLSKINVIDTLIAPTAAGAARATVNTPKLAPKPTVPRTQPLRNREYPIVGPDAYGSLADDVPPRNPPPPAPVRSAAPANGSADHGAAPAIAAVAEAGAEPEAPGAGPSKESA
ncbi:MAG: Sec-independent protein translocase protein TatB [Polyangiaceae bacterium]